MSTFHLVVVSLLFGTSSPLYLLPPPGIVGRSAADHVRFFLWLLFGPFLSDLHPAEVSVEFYDLEEGRVLQHQRIHARICDAQRVDDPEEKLIQGDILPRAQFPSLFLTGTFSRDFIASWMMT